MTSVSINNYKKNQTILFIIVFFIIISSILSFSLPVFYMQLILASITLPLIMAKEFKTAVLYSIIYIVSIIYIFLVYFSNLLRYGNPYYIGGSDDLMFISQGLKVSQTDLYLPSKILESGIIEHWHNSSFFVSYMSSLIKFSNMISEFNIFLPLVMNVFYLIWICMIFEYLLKKFASFSITKINIFITFFALNPNIQYINSHVFRDTLNMLQIMLIIFIIEKLTTGYNVFNKIILLLLLALVGYITYYTRVNSLVFATGIALIILSEKFNLKKRFTTIPLILILTFSNIANSININSYIENYTDYVLNLSNNGLSSLIFNQPLFPFGIILRSLYAMITPFPNFLGLFNNMDSLLFDSIMFIIYCGVIVQFLFVPFMLKRLLKFDWLSLSFLICFVGVIATTFTFRHVILYFPFFVALAIEGYYGYDKFSRKLILLASLFIGTMMGLIYISLQIL